MKTLRSIAGVAIAILILLIHTHSFSSPGDPKTLEEINISPRMMDALTRAQQRLPDAPEGVHVANPSIARTILLQGFTNISVERLRGLLQWRGTSDPLFKPGVVPESGTQNIRPFVFERAQNWKQISDQVVSLDLVWIPATDSRSNHFIETQWYRKDGNAWYLFKQERKEMAGCNKWPRCVGDES